MSEITVTNTDWEILDDLKDSLAAATISGVTVFKNVGITTTVAQAKEFSFKNTEPRCFVLFLGQVEDHSLEDTRNAILEIAIYITVRSNTAGTTAARYEAKMQEIMRLMNAAKNAIETTPPTDAETGADNNWYENKLQWGSPDIDLDEAEPWTALTLPLTVSYGLDSPTSH